MCHRAWAQRHAAFIMGQAATYSRCNGQERTLSDTDCRWIGPELAKTAEPNNLPKPPGTSPTSDTASRDVQKLHVIQLQLHAPMSGVDPLSDSAQRVVE
jgi:hypothetical protein